MAGAGLQYAGTLSPLFKDFHVDLSSTGTKTSFRITTPNLDTLAVLANYYQGFGASVRFIGPDEAEDRELEVEIPGLTSTTAGVLEELFFDKWELVSNEGSDSIFADPFIVGPSGFLNYNDKVVLSRLSIDGGTISDAASSCNSDVSAGTLPAPGPGNGGTASNQFQAPTFAAAQQLAKEILKGQTDFYSPTWVLRHTSYCSPGQTYNNTVAGGGMIYSVAQLLSEVESGWVYPIPPRQSSKIASIPSQSAPSDEAPFYQWGWLKKVARESQMADFMIEVAVEYELALWSTLRYPLF